MNNVNSRYLLYKDYESGLNNELMSVELAVGLAYLTQRTLVYYGSIGENKQLMHIRGGNFFFVPEKRKAINLWIPAGMFLSIELLSSQTAITAPVSTCSKIRRPI